VACFHPLRGWYDGVRVQIGSPFRGANPLKLPCGKCDGCLLERSRQWGIRCYHEAQMYDASSFVTLTYDDEHLPENSSLRYRDFQLFMKRARRKMGPFRFFMCGEYGGDGGRPHYHACLFGLFFRDRVSLGSGASGSEIYASGLLSELWSNGYCSVGDVTFESACYVARYTAKKVGNDVERLGIVDFSTGEIYVRTPEFCRMSNGGRNRSGGIGATWWQSYSSDVKRRGDVVVRGKSMRPPRYYDKLLELENPALLERFKAERLAKVVPSDNTKARLLVKETVCKAKLKFFKRELV